MDLGAAGCIRDIAKATADIKVQVVFCNAGYIMKGFFYNRCETLGSGGCCLLSIAQSNMGKQAGTRLLSGTKWLWAQHHSSPWTSIAGPQCRCH